VLFLEIRIIGDKHINIYIPRPSYYKWKYKGNYYSDEGSLQSKAKYDVWNYKYSNSYVQTVTDIHRAIKKKVQSGIENHNGCNCYAFSVFYLDVGFGSKYILSSDIWQVPVKMLFIWILLTFAKNLIFLSVFKPNKRTKPIYNYLFWYLFTWRGYLFKGFGTVPCPALTA
jgi:hypothetical protein